MQAARRIATLDEFVSFVNREGITSLGSWIERQRNKNIPQKYNQATRRISTAGVTIVDLRSHWQAQLTAQVSLQSSPPVRVQRELGKIVSLQNQIEDIDDTLEQLQKTIDDRQSSNSAHIAIKDLQCTHSKLSEQAVHLYTSLDLETHYPELAGLPFEFVQTLLLMRDLKIQIRKQAIGTFLEWENLDRAVQGRREPLGTKLHQAARKALSKRQPALHRLIDKFNSFCSRLEEIQPPHCSVPIPLPLPTKLNELKSHTNLFEDIWITPSEGGVPLWLCDENVRQGISSLHVLDRCHEEDLRLSRESENMLRWIDQESLLLASAKERHSNHILHHELEQEAKFLSRVSSRWRRQLQIPQPLLLAIDPRLTTHSQNSAPAAPPAAPPAASPAAPPVSPPAAALPSDPAVNLSMVEPVEDDMNESPWADSENISPDEVEACPSDSEEALAVTDMMETDDDEDTATLKRDHCHVQVSWASLAKSRSTCDTHFVRDLTAHVTRFPVIRDLQPRVVALPGNLPTIVVDPNDLALLTDSTARLNGHILNGVSAAVLSWCMQPFSLHAQSAQRCALLSTYDLHRVRFNAPDKAIWKSLAPTEYWKKSVWIVPVHRQAQEHWALVIVLVHEQKLLLFDSLAQKRPWYTDTKNIMLLVTRMTLLAHRNGHSLPLSMDGEAWTAEPMISIAVQCNSYDCGVWVLVMIAAVLRGMLGSNITEPEIPFLRHTLTNFMLTLPCKSS
ncbi:unnamed protein product [Mycena citricolor]|uniref:Ubiquitin-like protease family profile domain-containing protein n=1 Tax=Mycena citricolor TaxID=2018698 RepID=A0AAD2H184_9AGAR|nr:unnamed protein product [Mycena citricolor]